ncbi:CRTAC1 family protein [Pelagicoccus sp. SDUM812002]|uniref:CRTAC1 family protein n=1 Tax=Pelagicoccus sp. SDUM812002 TaxID=3041266 RepID=UPI00280E1B1D|nr:CRTAC1 family protein [Pelagicoccus sp. SDUM812002]MDQ8184764.1 CRTAC1 family protein [Pelagicoccus sp. SDUM812002]
MNTFTGPRKRRILQLLALTTTISGTTLFSQDHGDVAQPESTRRMVERLDQIDREVDPSVIMFVPDQALSFFREKIDQALTEQATLSLKPPYAMALLNSGDPEGAIAEFKAFRESLTSMGMEINPNMRAELLKIEAICYLRLGEQQNCLHNHNADSCLFPIQGGGVHAQEFGSRKAIEKLMELLEVDPTPYAAWLLNIAYMTLGEYPEQVPQSWRLPPETFQSDYEITRFPDVAGPLGLDVNDLSGGVVMEDFDQDGYLDLLASSWGEKRQLRYFRNQGDGSFAELTNSAWLTGLTGGLNMVPGDYNNDGLVDVLVLREGWLGKDGRFPNSLLRNNGDNTFTDVTEETGLLSFHPTQTATWLDYNGDGWLDIFIGNETVPETGANDPCELFRNNGDGTFTECAAESGLDIKDWIKGVVSGDYNNDGRPDLYLSSLVGPNRLLRNDGAADGSDDPNAPHSFTDVAQAAGVTEPNSSFPCWFFDYNNDGWLDIFVTGYSIKDAGDVLVDYLGAKHGGERARLYQNNGDGTFKDVTEAKGLLRILHAMGSNFGDIDSDGWLDFYVGTGDPNLGTIIPNLMFRNDAARTFQDVTTSGGFGQLQKGHGIAFGDINQDGAQDIYSVVGGAFSGDNYHNQLFANPGHENRWIKLRLKGVTSNRIGFGSRIKVVVETPEGTREIHRVVSSGGSFGASPFLADIGLGNATSIKRIEINWPANDQNQVIESIELDRSYLIEEGSAEITEVTQPSFEWPDDSAGQGHDHHHH